MKRLFTLFALTSIAIIGCSDTPPATDTPQPKATGQVGSGIDEAKKKVLLKKLASMGDHQVATVPEFFGGNDDMGSIGCNLPEHPGIPRFKEILTGLEARKDVKRVYLQISELDPGQGFWPFVDTVLVVGTIPQSELNKILYPLQPDEVGEAKAFGVPQTFLDKQGGNVLAAWWD